MVFPAAEQHDVDDDLYFAARAMAIMGPAVRHWREAQAKALKAVAAAVRPLERKLRAVRPQHMEAAHEHKAPAAMAAATVLLRWPDREQPRKYVVGFDVVGELAPSGIFRDVQLPAADTELGGATGLDHLLALLRPRPTPPS